jgi:two-component system response regulator FixJ
MVVHVRSRAQATGVRVYLVDDDEAVRRSLAKLLAVCGFNVTSYASGTEFLRSLPGLDPGCVLLDLRMPDMSGLAVQAEIAKVDRVLPVIFLTAHGDVPTGVQAMKRGAVDFLEKPVEGHQLQAALAAGAVRLGRRLERDATRARARARLATLTPREREVIGLVVRGQRSRTIARELNISVQTVKVHRMRGMAKMEAATLPELTREWDAAEA